MATEQVLTISDTNFSQEVLASSTPVLIDFWAPWCAPCRAIAPTIDAIAAAYQGKVKVGKINVDESQEVANQFGIRSIPTLLVFKGGKVVDQIVGGVSKDQISNMLNRALSA